MEKNDQSKIAGLVTEIAGVVEKAGCTYGEVLSAIGILTNHYRREADYFIKNAGINDVARYSQTIFEQEKEKAAPGGTDAAEQEENH